MIEKISLPTISGLMLPQSIKIVRLFVECNNWAEVKAKAVETNVMQIDKLASSSRYISYIIKHLKNLTLEEIQFVDGAGIEDQRTLLWIAFCRTFPIVGLFASEVVHQKFLSYEKTLSFSDWNEFLSRKANENDSIDNIGKETRKKARSVIFSYSPVLYGSINDEPADIATAPFFIHSSILSRFTPPEGRSLT